MFKQRNPSYVSSLLLELQEILSFQWHQLRRACLKPLGISNMHTRLRMSDRHARLGISIRCGAHELKSILMRRANSEYVCMYVCWACMYVCILNYRPRGWVQFLTKNVQYLNDNSIFWDLWGGVLPDALTCIHTCLAYIHTYIHTSFAIRTPPQGEGFWKTLHRERVFETYIHA